MKAILRVSLCILMILFFDHYALAQKSIIRGQVTDENKAPLAGVTIVVAGKNVSAI